jgi:hypothetical protein
VWWFIGLRKEIPYLPYVCTYVGCALYDINTTFLGIFKIRPVIVHVQVSKSKHTLMSILFINSYDAQTQMMLKRWFPGF